MEERTLYEKYASKRHWEKHSINYAKFFADFLKRKNFNGLIVDLGCGNGRDVNIFAENGFNILGVDNSEKELELAKRNFPKLSFELQDIEKLSFRDNSVSAFFIINVIHYTNKEKAIKEIYRTLKPKGFCFIHFNLKIVDKEGKVDYEHKEEEILDLVKKFKIVHKKSLRE